MRPSTTHFTLPSQFLSQDFYQKNWRKPLVMGILNVTQDSFSDGGRYLDTAQATSHALEMIAQGADVIDIGGEATNPGAGPISVDEELKRVIPTLEAIRSQSDIFISIDTSKPEVMRAAIDAGASMINDVTGFGNVSSRLIAAEHNVPICIMHMKGKPASMQKAPDYPDGVIKEIYHFFKERIALCVADGIPKEKIILDPGFGFGKLACHNLHIIREIDGFRELGCPILLGFSRKSTIGEILNQPIEKRLIGGIALTVFAAIQGAYMFRTHDVEATKQALTMLDALMMPDLYQSSTSGE